MDQHSAVRFRVLRNLEPDERRGDETKTTFTRDSSDVHHSGRGDSCPASLVRLAISVALA